MWAGIGEWLKRGSVIEIVSLIADLLRYAETFKKYPEALEHTLIFYFFDDKVDMWMLVGNLCERIFQFLCHVFYAPVLVYLAHIDPIELYRIDFEEMINTKDIVVPDRMEVVHSDRVSFFSKFCKDLVESHIIVDRFRFQYFQYNSRCIDLVGFLKSGDVFEKIISVLESGWVDIDRTRQYRLVL